MNVDIGGSAIGNDQPLAVFGGVNVLESADLALKTAQTLVADCEALGMPRVFKASFDKANRTAVDSPRGPGLEEGLRMLEAVKREFDVAVMTDIHLPQQAKPAAEVADVLQIPAFLCRQTDLLQAAAATGAALNIKKAQFLAAEDMRHVLDKCRAAGNDRLMLCERGSSFGYHNLVVDMLGFEDMKAAGAALLFDASHSLQRPGAGPDGRSAGGRRSRIAPLARSAVAQGIAGIFVETHPDPDKALCDGPCALPLSQLRPFLEQLKAVDTLVKSLSPLSVP